MWKKPVTKRAGGVAQCVGTEFKSQYHKKKFFINIYVTDDSLFL
jgi:hypothetical protein